MIWTPEKILALRQHCKGSLPDGSMSQREMAIQVGCDQNTICRLETGKHAARDYHVVSGLNRLAEVEHFEGGES